MKCVSRFFIVLVFLLLSHYSSVAGAQSLIRDAEIEGDLRLISEPIFSASGLSPSQVKIIVLNDDGVNAFVAGGQNLFLHTGLILETKEIGELAGVIAHEAGHMAGGHLVRMRDAASRASMESMLATALGVAVGVGAGNADAGMAAVMGGGEFANRSFLRNSRVFENSADQAGMAALDRAGYSTRGMAAFLERLGGQEILPEMQRSAYIRTHPMSRERLAAVESFMARSRNRDKEWPKTLIEKFDRMRAKLLGFTQPQQALRVYAEDNSIAGRYGRAIAEYRSGRINDALSLVAALEQAEPQNPYFIELRGQILFEQGRIDEATKAYDKAATLAPKAGLIHLALAQALLQNARNPPARALTHLQKARDNGEQDTPMVYRWMALAYGRQGKEGLAKLALAEEALLKRDYSFAITQAKRAEALLQNDPAATQRARDTAASAARMQRERK